MSGAQMVLMTSASVGDVQIVTTGALGTIPDRLRGFSSGTPSFGSINTGFTPIYGLYITGLYWDEGSGSPFYILDIPGATDGGWSQLTIGTTTLSRTSATFTLGGTWEWNAPSIATQAFSTAGSVITCTFS